MDVGSYTNAASSPAKRTPDMKFHERVGRANVMLVWRRACLSRSLTVCFRMRIGQPSWPSFDPVVEQYQPCRSVRLARLEIADAEDAFSSTV